MQCGDGKREEPGQPAVVAEKKSGYAWVEICILVVSMVF